MLWKSAIWSLPSAKVRDREECCDNQIESCNTMTLAYVVHGVCHLAVNAALRYWQCVLVTVAVD